MTRKSEGVLVHHHAMVDGAAEKPGIISCNGLTTGVADMQCIKMCQLLRWLPN
jgi:hypothetical protein